MKSHYRTRLDDATLWLADLNVQLQRLEWFGPSAPMTVAIYIRLSLEDGTG